MIGWTRAMAAAVLCWTVLGMSTRTIDGDTFVAELEIWPGVRVTEHIRVLGVDTPERTEATRGAWASARDFTAGWLDRQQIVVTACRRDSFGRLLGRVTKDNATRDLARDIIGAGHGRPR